MFKKCILSLLVLMPSYSVAVTDNMANGTTAAAGLLGVFGGKYCMNQFSSNTSDAVIGATVFGAAGAGLMYWYWRDKRPTARLEQAKQIIIDVDRKPVLQSTDFITKINQKFATKDYPLVAGATYLGELLPKVKHARQLLKWAVNDVQVDQLYNNQSLLGQIRVVQSQSATLKQSIQNRLVAVKSNDAYQRQEDVAYARKCSDTYLELLRKGASAQQITAEAQRLSAQAQQTNADANALNSFTGLANLFSGNQISRNDSNV